MLKGMILVVLLVAATAFDCLLPAAIVPGAVRWPLLLTAVLCVGLRYHLEHVAVFATAAGALRDLLGDAPLGLSSLAFLAGGCATWAVRRCWRTDLSAVQALVGLIGGVAVVLLAWGLVRCRTPVFAPFRRAAWWSAETGLLCAGFTPAMASLLDRVDRLLCPFTSPDIFADPSRDGTFP